MLEWERNVVANIFCLGLIPFLGYHHVLMILIAIAIILLCKSLLSFWKHSWNES